MQIGKLSSGDLKLLLAYYPQLAGSELEEARPMLLAKEDLIFSADAPKASWCQLYELPADQHFVQVAVALSAGEVVREIAQSPNPILALPDAVAKQSAEIDAWEITEEEEAEYRKSLPVLFGLSVSVINSVRSLMIFGCYLNELIAKSREGGDIGDRALLSAVKIDPTVLGCPTDGDKGEIHGRASGKIPDRARQETKLFVGYRSSRIGSAGDCEWRQVVHF